MALESTPDGDELVSAHLAEYQKTRNVRRDPRVAVTILSTEHPGQQTPYLTITGTARIVEGGAPELLKKLAKVMLGSDEHFPPPERPGGTAHPRPDREGRRLRALGVLTRSGCNTFQFVPSFVACVAGSCSSIAVHGGRRRS